MKKALSIMSIISVFACLAFGQVNINSTTNVQNGNNNNDALTSTNQYTGTATDRIGVHGLSLQQPDWGNGGIFEGGYQGVLGFATMTGIGDRYGVRGFATGGLSYGSGNTLYGGLFFAYNSKGAKIGIKGGVWNDDNTVPACQYAVLGQAVGTVAIKDTATIKSYGVYCMGNGAATGTWTWASDEKLKTNIQPVSGVLAKIKQLNAVTYNYDVAKYPSMGLDPNKKIGFTAQNVEAVFPELVRNDVCPAASMPKDGIEKKGEVTSLPTSYKGVDYIGLIPVLLSAIQEQQKQIEALTAKVK